MKRKTEILRGVKKSKLNSSLSDFEALKPQQFSLIADTHQVPDGFLFAVGICKYKKKDGNSGCFLRCGKDELFMQSFLPHKKREVYPTRGYGQIFSTYEPEQRQVDDVVLSESAIYQREGNCVRLILANGECRDKNCVAQMFEYIRQQRHFLNFAAPSALPSIYKVTFKRRSYGYYLKDRSYYVFATPVGIPNVQSGDVVKSWLFCDINCGIPGIIPCDSEEFEVVECNDGDKVSIFTLRDNVLVYEG